MTGAAKVQAMKGKNASMELALSSLTLGDLPLSEFHGVASTLKNQLGELLEELDSEPQQAEKILKSTELDLISKAKAVRDGGVFYRVFGAAPQWMSPMQYGGHFLELERSVLESFSEDLVKVAYIEESPETYLDFLTDLPVDVLAWQGAATQTPVEIRPLTPKILAHPGSDGDVLLLPALAP